MPIFEYKCENCGKIYDVFHKSSEIKSDIVCPNCKSNEYKRLISSTAILKINSVSSKESIPLCKEANGCCDGSCPII